MIDVQMMIKDYEPPVEDIWTEEEDEMIMLKKAVQSLSPADRIIFLLYAEYGSLRQVGKELGVSHTTIYKQINLIKTQIREWCNEHYPNNKSFNL
ncbi:MAG: helix-turn-helix domain-containing protein [Acutalibacteraceae bacterium]|jgi:RNA polymerase sigma-70 factor (ECF subfamily)